MPLCEHERGRPACPINVPPLADCGLARCAGSVRRATALSLRATALSSLRATALSSRARATFTNSTQPRAALSSRAKHSAHALDVGTAYAAALHRPTILATARPQLCCDSRRRRLLLQRHRGAGAPLPDAGPPPARLLFAARVSRDRRIATCLESWAADRLGAHVASDRPIAAGVAHDGTL